MLYVIVLHDIHFCACVNRATLCIVFQLRQLTICYCCACLSEKFCVFFGWEICTVKDAAGILKKYFAKILLFLTFAKINFLCCYCSWTGR